MVYGLRAQTQNMTGIRAQRKGLRAQKNGIRVTKLLSPNQGSDLLHGLKISYHNFFPHNKVCVHTISRPRYIYLFLLPAGGSSCHTKSWLFDENMVSYS